MDQNKLFENIKEFGKVASKDLGQNYLINPKICKDIVSIIKPSNSLLEIGSGLGALSYFFDTKINKKIFLNEVDLRSIQFLKDNFSKQNVEIIERSFLKIEIVNYETIVGNLPYYITSHCLEKIMIEASLLKQGIFMVQKEFYERLVGDKKDYGPLFIISKLIGDFKREFLVNKTDFCPAPNVDSLVFQFVVKKQKPLEWKKGFWYFLNKMFLHRRKTIFNNLSLYLKNKILASTILKQAGLENNLRPEQITPEQYEILFNIVLK